MAARRTRWSGLALVALLAACKGASGGAGPLYTVVTEPAKAAVGAKAAATVRFVPKSGYHWNDEFPAKAKVTDAAGLQLQKTDFATADFAVDGKNGVLAIPLVASAAGDATLKAKADFAVCDDKGCIPFKDVPIEVAVHAQ
jgi:hypothetical protein